MRDRFSFSVLLKIHENAKILIIEPNFIEYILHGDNYPNLNELKLLVVHFSKEVFFTPVHKEDIDMNNFIGFDLDEFESSLKT